MNRLKQRCPMLHTLVGIAAFTLISLHTIESFPDAGESEGRTNLTLRKEIEADVMCPCEDKCGKVLINCTCDFSYEMRAELDQYIKNGMDKEAVIKLLLEKYGEKVLAAPTKTGFNILAWVFPFIAISAAAAGIGIVIKRWIKSSRPGEVKALVSPEPGSVAGSREEEAQEYAQKLEAELKKMED